MRRTLAAREARLAFWMLAPTLAIVFAIVIFPVLANLWLSVKPVRLQDLRAPVPVVRETVLLPDPDFGPDEPTLRLRVSNRTETEITGVAVRRALPPALEILGTPPGCRLDRAVLECRVDLLRARASVDFEVPLAGLAPDAFEAPGEAATATGRADSILTNLDFTLGNFVRVFAAAEFWPNLKTTIWYALFSSIFSIVVGLGAALLMNVKFIGRGFFRGLFLFPYIAPVIAVAFTWAFLLDPFSGVINALLLKYGLADQPVLFLSQRTLPLDLAGLRIGLPLALTTVILFEVWRYSPFAFLFILARLQALPAELNEASAVDGASPFQRFWHVTLPQLSGVMAVLFMLRFIWTFNKFDDIFLLTGGAAGTKTITIQVYDYAFALADLGTGAATALVLFAVLGLFLIIYFRWIEGRADTA